MPGTTSSKIPSKYGNLFEYSLKMWEFCQKNLIIIFWSFYQDWEIFPIINSFLGIFPCSANLGATVTRDCRTVRCESNGLYFLLPNLHFVSPNCHKLYLLVLEFQHGKSTCPREKLIFQLLCLCLLWIKQHFVWLTF